MLAFKFREKNIDWACHYSRVNTLHIGGDEEDFWIRRTFPGREPFLNDLDEKVGTTGHTPHICNVVKRGGDVAKWQLLGRLITLVIRPWCLDRMDPGTSL